MIWLKKINFKNNVQMFARSLIAPITLLAFAGLFLGIGAVIGKYNPSGFGNVFANIIKNIGGIVFTLLPLLFAMAIAASFTNNSGTAVITSVVVYVALLAFSGAQFVKYETTDSTLGGYAWFNVIKFPSAERASVISTTLGFKTLNLSVFGGLIAGPVAAFTFNKFEKQRMPAFLQMFQGHRFVPIMGIIISIPLAFFLALLWPWVSRGFILFGEKSGKLGGGIDSLLFGVFERALLPTGLHHMFYSPLLYTSAGAHVVATAQISEQVAINSHYFAAGTHLYEIDVTPWFKSATVLSTYTDQLPNIKGFQMSSADWETAFNAGHTKILYGDRTAFQEINGSVIQFAWIDKLQGASYHLGRFAAGKVPVMVFWIPAAGLAMIMSAPKEKRKIVTGVVGTAALTSFLTGITEPFEYTFLFVAPLLFFGFHIFMAGTSYMFAQLAGVYYGPTFGGIIDLVIYGIIPQATGQSTNFWWLIVIGVAGMPIYYFVFYFAIKKWDLKTPGRDSNNSEISLITKTKFQKNKLDKKEDPLMQKANIMYKAFGGFANILNISNCASRLRVTVKDPKKVNYELGKTAKPFGVVGKNKKSQQWVFGPSVQLIADEVNRLFNKKK